MDIPNAPIRLLVHLIEKDEGSLLSQRIDADRDLTIQECVTIISDKLKMPLENLSCRLAVDGEDISLATKLFYFSSNVSELLFFYEEIKAEVKPVAKRVEYETLTNYALLDDAKLLKVYVPLEGVETLPADRIYSRFLYRSLEVKVHNLNGKNYLFAVPKTQCYIFKYGSKVAAKKGKLIITIVKVAESDNWFSLHKTKLIGYKDRD